MSPSHSAPEGLRGTSGVKPLRDRLVDGSLPIFLEQLEESLPATEVAADAPIGVIEVANDSGLLGEGWITAYIADKHPLG